MFMAPRKTGFPHEDKGSTHFTVDFQHLNASHKTHHMLYPHSKCVLLTFQHELRRLQPGKGGLGAVRGRPP